jgi:CarD family transcriptional regulator
MKEVGDYVVFRKEVCKITEIKENYMKGVDYYHLVPIYDESLHLDIPVTTDKKYLRDLISEKELHDLIKKIPFIECIKCDDKTLENRYKELLNSGNLEDYIRIIKTTYSRNQERILNKKKISDKDNYYFNLAEKYLYNEFGVILNKNFEETKEYIFSCLKK